VVVLTIIAYRQGTLAKLDAERTNIVPASLLELVLQFLVLFRIDVAADGAMETKAD
jgi:hypothetical protein